MSGQVGLEAVSAAGIVAAVYVAAVASNVYVSMELADMSSLLEAEASCRRVAYSLDACYLKGDGAELAFEAGHDYLVRGGVVSSGDDYCLTRASLAEDSTQISGGAHLARNRGGIVYVE